MEGSVCGLISRQAYNPRIVLEGLKKTTKNLSQDSLSQSRDSNPGPPEYNEIQTRVY
jgi:hypothetical protein